jgi:hypothetical protein
VEPASVPASTPAVAASGVPPSSCAAEEEEPGPELLDKGVPWLLPAALDVPITDDDGIPTLLEMVVVLLLPVLVPLEEDEDEDEDDEPPSEESTGTLVHPATNAPSTTIRRTWKAMAHALPWLMQVCQRRQKDVRRFIPEYRCATSGP